MEQEALRIVRFLRYLKGFWYLFMCSVLLGGFHLIFRLCFFHERWGLKLSSDCRIFFKVFDIFLVDPYKMNINMLFIFFESFKVSTLFLSKMIKQK